MHRLEAFRSLAPLAAVLLLLSVQPATAKDESCRKITGRMTLRLLELRNRPTLTPATGTARAVQQAVTPIFGGSERGASPEAELATDRTALDADNRRLVEKGCPSFDIDAALASDPRGPSPRATVLPAAKKAAPAAK